MDSSRRRILQLLGLSSLALTAKPVFNAFAVEEHAEKPKAILKDGENALKAKQWALVIDTRQFESEEDLDRCGNRYRRDVAGQLGRRLLEHRAHPVISAVTAKNQREDRCANQDQEYHAA